MAEESQTSDPQEQTEQPTGSPAPQAEGPAAAEGAPTAPPAARPRPGQQQGPPLGERDPAKPGVEELSAVLKDAWEGIAYEQKLNFGDLEVAIQPQDVLDACRRAKQHPRLSMDYLMCISGTDYETYFDVVYHLYSYRDHRRLMIRTKLDYENPMVSSVTSVWKGADWHEREAAEMLGISFSGHPDMRPLLLDDDVEDRPLRKSHPLVALYADRPGVVTRPNDN